MGGLTEWTFKGPNPEVHADITSGSLTLLSTSKLVNYADFGWSPVEVAAFVFKNGQAATTLSINSSTGAVTGSAVSVASGDTLEIRFEFSTGYKWPWQSKVFLRRSAFFTAPAGNGTFDFDGSNNVMPTPGFALAFGWDAADKVKVGFKVTSADGAGQSLSCITRRLPTAQETSTNINLADTTNTQTHTSSFGRGDISGEFEIEMFLKSGTGAVRMEDRNRITFGEKALLAGYPPSFPTDQVRVVQTKASGRVNFGAP